MLTRVAFMLQMVVLFATLAVCVLAMVTSRSRRLQHRAYRGLAIALAVMALMGVTLTVVAALLLEPELDYWLELLAPTVTLLLSGLILWRTRTTGSRRRHSGDTRSGVTTR